MYRSYGFVARARVLTVAALAMLATVAADRTAQAQNWPDRPVRVLVGFAAGGNIDVLARLTAARLSEALGQQFIIENRVGAMGTIAADNAIRATPDGYTLFWGGAGTISIFPAMSTSAFDPKKDLKAISIVGTNPQVLIINPKLPAKNLQEFIDHVKKQPGQLSYAGGGGPGSLSNLLMALFLKRAGIEMTAVSYRGTAPALNDLIAGHIPAMFIPLSEALPHAQGGKIRMLAVSTATRARQAPDVPTVAESGFPGYDGASWNGLFAPAATPDAIVDKIAAEFARAAKDPEFIKHLDQHGVDPQGFSPAETRKFIDADMALWAEAVKIAGVKLQN